MRHFVQYFNPDKVGRDPDALSELAVFTNKYVRGVPLEGNTLWHVTGKGSPRIYRLGLWFIIERVEAAEHPFFVSRLVGSRGHIFRPQPRIDRSPWFPAFRRSQGNFAFGLNEITDPEVIGAFQSLATEAGASLPR